jgi:hypothetical protein
MKDAFSSLLKSRKFLLAAFAIVQTVLFQFVPDFPPAVWQAIDALVAVLITMIAVEDAALKSSGKWVG